MKIRIKIVKTKNRRWWFDYLHLPMKRYVFMQPYYFMISIMF